MTTPTANAASELKPCPFCGSKSITVGYFGQPAQTIFAACRTCGANGPTHQYYGGIGSPVIDLGESWNRRAHPGQPEPRAEAVGCLTVHRFRGADSMVNTDFDYYGNLPDGSYPLYTGSVLVPRAEVTDWRTIETAPRDGRSLLLGYPNAAGNWRTVRGQWMSEDYIAEYWENPDDVDPGWFEAPVEADDVPNCWRIHPTHWMPLPAAPTTDEVPHD